MDTKIYSIFPACGKTWLYEHQEDYGLKILDSDSSKFSWVYVNGVRERNTSFPDNYIKHIKENMGKYDCIFVSSHESVRNALDEEGIKFTIVYPENRCKAEWIGRCFIREMNAESGCSAKVLYDNWEQWNSDCFMAGVDHEKIVLEPNKYLRDYLMV